MRGKLILALTPIVLGHGGVWNYTIAEVDYPGYQWWTADAGQISMQRRWASRNPIQSALDPHFACNIAGTPTTPSTHMKIAAGETILAHYEKNFCIGEMGGSPSNPIPAPCNETWGHEWGPITAYMAACNGPCEDVDVNDGKPIWFKIYEAGLVNGTAGGGFWEQMRLHNGEAWSVKIPEKLKAGNYLIRHEVIAVHVQPHQFYMECAQLEVTGYGTTAPNDEDLVAFPGAYDPNEFLNYQLWTTNYNDTSYKIPGPAVWSPE